MTKSIIYNTLCLTLFSLSITSGRKKKNHTYKNPRWSSWNIIEKRRHDYEQQQSRGKRNEQKNLFDFIRMKILLCFMYDYDRINGDNHAITFHLISCAGIDFNTLMYAKSTYTSEYVIDDDTENMVNLLVSHFECSNPFVWVNSLRKYSAVLIDRYWWCCTLYFYYANTACRLVVAYFNVYTEQPTVVPVGSSFDVEPI